MKWSKSLRNQLLFGGIIMEDILRPLFEQCASKSTTLGIIIIEKEDRLLTTMDMFDVIVVVVAIWQDKPEVIKHYSYHEKKMAIYIVDERRIQEWMLLGSQPKMIDMLREGHILFDRDRFMENLRNELRSPITKKRKLTIGLEFAELIRKYTEGKVFFKKEQFFHAYYHAVYALYHLGKMAVIENGFLPDSAIWRQIKQIEPEILKLYEELVLGDESIDKRLELLYLASEFLIYSKTPAGTEHLLGVMQEKPLWRFEEIAQHPQTKHYGANLSILLDYLIKRNVIVPIQVETNLKGIYERCYQT